MTLISNPILPGFHPDPSIVRVGNDYYIATSTFEWYPGVCIYHSSDLVNWELIARPLDRTDVLDMRGNPDSCGVWAPCLSYKNGIFYLAFTNTRRFKGDFKDTPNYIASSKSIEGPWTQPIHVNSSGFDPSLFHDEKGKSYWLNMVWDHRPRKTRCSQGANRFFHGISCQEIDISTGELLGKAKIIFKGSELGLAEGPHIFERNNFYYLVVAEGGTDRDHAVTIARSRSVWGPYELPDSRPLMTSRLTPKLALKRAGHGDFCSTVEGNTVLVHLCSRPLAYRGRAVMGRETALQYIEWINDWPRLKSGKNTPAESIETNSCTDITLRNELIDFKSQTLPSSYHSLRYPLPKNILYYLNQSLVLHGQESLGSLFEQSLMARRQQHFCFTYTVELSFAPESFQQMAGLVCYYNSEQYYYVYVTLDEKRGKVMELVSCQGEAICTYHLEENIKLPDEGKLTLKAHVEYDLLHFAFKTENAEWVWLSKNLDYSILSDECGEGGAGANFTGAFVGIACQDLSGSRKPAYFHSVEYKEFTDNA